MVFSNKKGEKMISWRNGRSKGSITVYLTLTMIILLALVATFLENARVSVAGHELKKTIQGAVDAEFTNYYRPLYEDYGLFFMDKGIESDSLLKRVVANDIKKYVEESLCNQTSSSVLGYDVSLNGTDLYQTKINSLQTTSVVKAVDCDGGLWEDEVIQFMKYQVTGDMLKKMLEQCGLLEKNKTVSQIMKEEAKAEEALGTTSELLLELMEQVEGIKCKKQGLSFDQNKKLVTTEYFAKRICGKEITKENVGVTPQIVYQSLQPRYSNATKQLKGIEDLLKELKREYAEEEKRKEEEKERQEKEKRKEEEREREKEEEKKKAELEKKSGNTKAPTQTPKPTPMITPTAKPTPTPIPTYAFSKTIKKANDQQSQLRTEVSNTKKKIKDAISTIGKIENKIGGVEKEVNNYEKVVKKEKKNLSEEEYKSMNKQRTEMKEDLEHLKDAVKMKAKLEENKKILESLETELGKKVKQDINSYTDKLAGIQIQIKAMKGYDISTLKFYYGTIKNQGGKNPNDGLKGLGKSVLSIVVENEKDISTKKMENPDYYYTTYKGTIKGQKNTRPGDLVGGKNPTDIFSEAMEVFGGETNQNNSSVINKLIYQAYINKYFQSFVDKKERFSKAPLKYEQEYILCGNGSDKENLQSVVDRILLTRTIINFTYLLTDTTAKEKAYGAAAALVGFTGIEPLIRATQMGILLVWGYEESLVDIAALLKGSKIPLFKTKQSFMLDFSDLFIISKKLIHSRARELGKIKMLSTGISYEQYLDIFLFLENQSQKNYRTMDIIEGNIKLRHNKKFSINDCIYACKIMCNYQVPAKFLNWGFVKNWESKNNNWEFTMNEEYSY